MSPSPFSNMNFFCSEIFTQLNHNMIFFHGLWMDNVCRSKFEDRLNRFKSCLLVEKVKDFDFHSAAILLFYI